MDHQSFMEKQQDTLNEQIRKDPTKLTVIELAKEFGKPAYRLNCCGIEINKDSKEELKGISHREMFGFINSVLQSRATEIANRVDGLVIPKIAVLVDRFLSWELPNDFNPDCGISFNPNFNEHTDFPMKHEPTGTNLFNAEQVKAMFEYLLDDSNFSE